MNGFLNRFTEVNSRLACVSCDEEFIVTVSSLLQKCLPRYRKMRYCVFCGKLLDLEAINKAENIRKEA